MEDRILVIPDIHGRDFWKEAVTKYEGIDTIFLGDYLDPYYHEGITHNQARKNFNEILEYARNHDNVTLLFGNHDLVYWFPYDWGRKDRMREEEIFNQFKENISLFHIFATRVVEGKKWLFSHAPLFEEWIDYTKMPHNLKDLETKIWELLEAYNQYDSDTAKHLSWESRREPHDNVWNTLGRASKKRGGRDICGSPVWADVEEVETTCRMYSDADYYVFGHTQQDTPIITDKYACLDTHQAYMIGSDGSIRPVTEKHTPELPKDEGFSLF